MLGEVSQATEGASYERNGIVSPRGYGGMDSQLSGYGLAFTKRIQDIISGHNGRDRNLGSLIGR